MSIETAALKALQAAVGVENVRTDPATLSCYAWNSGMMPGPKFTFFPAAIVLPKSTEEVAAIVRACNANGLKFRPLSTGNGTFYLSHQPNVVVLDLVRMDRILKIDRANQMAVIQPYATAGRLMAEAMKVGLTCHVIGAGPGHSPLASATSMLGIGITGSSTGHNARNILALEWVTVDGEIVRIGTTGEDWFSEEGPGIGFRGMIRGYFGAHGALGIFTCIGYKLYPWAGARKLERTGVFPQDGMPLSENMRFFAPVWPSSEQVRDAVMRLNHSGQMFAVLRMPPANIGFVLTRSNNEYRDRRLNGTLPEIARDESRHGLQVLTIGHSPAQVAHQEKLVRLIVEETGGRMLALEREHAEMLVRGLVTSQYVGRARTNNGATSYGIADSWHLWPKAVESAEQLVKEDLASGDVFTEDAESHWAWPTENRQLWTEHVVAVRKSPRGGAIALVAFLRHVYLMQKQRLGIASFIAGPMIDMFGRTMHAGLWMRRIKRTLDPQAHADASMYISPKESAAMRVFPYVKGLLFSRAFKPVLLGMMSLMGRKAGAMKKADKADLGSAPPRVPESQTGGPAVRSPSA